MITFKFIRHNKLFYLKTVLKIILEKKNWLEGGKVLYQMFFYYCPIYFYNFYIL